MSTQRHQLSELLAPRDGELGRGLLAIMFGVVGQLAGVGLLASAAWLITTASLRPPVLTLTVAIAGVRMFALLRGTARYGERLASHDLALRALARMRVWAFAHLEPLVPGGSTRRGRGDLLARFVSDVDGLQDLYVRVALPLVSAASTAAITVVAAALLDPEAGLVLGVGLGTAVLILPLVTLVLGAYGGTRRAARRGERDGLIVELLHGSSELVVFEAEERWAGRVHAGDTAVAREESRASLATGLGHGMGVALGGLLAAAVVAASLPALDSRHISGVVVAVLGFLALGSAEAVSNLAESFAKLTGVLGGARRILALATTEGTSGTSMEKPRATSIPVGRLTTEGLHPPLTPHSIPRGVPTVRLDEVSVTYGDRLRPALDHVSLFIPPGDRVALIGASGAGKTTLGHLLLGFVQPTKGQVRFDGVDLTELDAEAARALVAWAPQDPHVFHTSLAANLRLARPLATDTDLVAALAQVGLEAWLGHLPDGLSTMLGERGNTVSGGERQRLGVARALLADRPVLVLDEPTAHLDKASEACLRASVLAASAGKTLVWVTHRLADLDAFDQVVRLHSGRVIPEDRCEEKPHQHAMLLAQRPRQPTG